MKEFFETVKTFLLYDVPVWVWIVIAVVLWLIVTLVRDHKATASSKKTKSANAKNNIDKFINSTNDAEKLYQKAEELANGTSLDEIPKAFKCYMKAADMGHVLAQCEAGRMCYYGSGTVRPDKEKGLALLKKSAKGGSVYARIILGRIYEKMRFEDPGEVLDWLEEIAERDAEAQYLLSRMYANKQEWYEKEKGYEPGQWKEDPQCIEWYDKAKYWLKQAVQNGSEDARDLYY